jgi:hypothetical protein
LRRFRGLRLCGEAGLGDHVAGDEPALLLPVPASRIALRALRDDFAAMSG